MTCAPGLVGLRLLTLVSSVVCTESGFGFTDAARTVGGDCC